MNIPKKTIICTLIAAIILGCILWGVRVSKDLFEKKVLTFINTQLPDNISGRIKWQNCKWNPFTNTITFEDILFFSKKSDFPFSAQKVHIRYSLFHLLGFRKLFFPKIVLEGVKGEYTASFAEEIDKSDIFKSFPCNKELWRRILFKADMLFGKVKVYEGSWEINLPKMKRKIFFHQVEAISDFSSPNVLDVQVHVPKIQVNRADRTEFFSLPLAKFRLMENSFSIDSFSLSDQKGEKIRMHGQISQLFSECPVFEGAYQADLRGERLKVWLPHLPFRSSSFTISGQILGDTRSPLMKGSVHLAELTFDGGQISDVQDIQIGYIYTKDKITFKNISLSLLSGELSGHGEFFLPERKFSFTAFADKLKLLSSSTLFSSSFQSFPPSFVLGIFSFLKGPIPSEIMEKYPLCDGKICFKGQILKNQQMIGTGDIDLRFNSLHHSLDDWFSLKTEFSVTERERIRFVGSELRLGEKNVLSFWGDLNYEENINNFHFILQLADFSKIREIWPSLKGKKMSGNLSFQGEIFGSFSDPKIKGLLEWQEACFKKYQARKVKGMLRYDKEHLFFSDFRLQQNQTLIEIKGSISTSTGQGNLQAMADSIYYEDLEQILSLRAPVLITGKMVCRSDFQILPGTPQKFFGTGQVTTGKWSIADKRRPFLKQHFDSVTGKFEVDAHSFRLYETKGFRGTQEVLAELVFPNKHSVPKEKPLFQFTSTELDLSSFDFIRSKQVPLKGKTSFQVHGEGKLGHGKWEWQVKIKQPEYRGFSYDQAVVKLFLHEKEYEGEAEIGANRVAFQGNLEKGISYHLAGQVSQFSLKCDQSFFSPQPADVKKKGILSQIFIELSGYIEASGCLRDFRQSDGKFKVQAATIHAPFCVLLAKQPFTITYKKGQVIMPVSSFSGEKAYAQLKAEADWGKSITISLAGNLPLSCLEKKYPNISDPKGDIRFDFSLAGPLENPQFAGTLHLVDSAFGLRQLNRRFEDLHGDFFIDKNTISILNMTGKSYDGRFVLSGRLHLQDVKIISGDLNLKGENILLIHSKKDKFLVDGDLHWQGNREHSTLAGTITVQEGIYNRNIGIIRSLLTKRRRIEIDGKSLGALQQSKINWLNNLSYNMQVHIPQNVWVTSTFFNMEISTSEFAIKGDFFRPYLEGQIRTQNGNILLGGNKFQILSGLMELTDPEQRSPSLDVSAATDIDAYRITANIYGFVDDPQIRLSSMPYLPQSDILNMIALGFSSNGRAGEGLVGQMAMATSFLLSDIFGQELTSASGIDLFRTKVLNKDLFQLDLFKLKVGEESGSVERITVGKDITKRLQLKYSVPAGEEGRDITEADYRFSDNIRLIGSQDDLGTYSLDLNFSLEF